MQNKVFKLNDEVWFSYGWQVNKGVIKEIIISDATVCYNIESVEHRQYFYSIYTYNIDNTLGNFIEGVKLYSNYDDIISELKNIPSIKVSDFSIKDVPFEIGDTVYILEFEKHTFNRFNVVSRTVKTIIADKEGIRVTFKEEKNGVWLLKDVYCNKEAAMEDAVKKTEQFLNINIEKRASYIAEYFLRKKFL